MKRNVVVSQWLSVHVDESKFTPEFMAEFREQFYPFTTVEQHIEHLAQLYARGLVDENTPFIEGYGTVANFGIRFEATDVESSVLAVP